MRNPNRNLNRELLDEATMHKARLRGHGKPICYEVLLPKAKIARVRVFNREPIPPATPAPPRKVSP